MRAVALIVAGLLFVVVNSGAAERTSPQPSPSTGAKKPEKKATPQGQGSPVNKFLGETGTNPNEPTTTEIYSDEAFFDSSKSMGIFTGHVRVVDPRFNLQSDKLTVFISKSHANQTTQPGQSPQPSQTPPAGDGAETGQGQGLEKAIAEGNVAVVRDRPDPNGGPPTRAVGRSQIATYVAATGDVELKGTPRVQQGENTHIATTPETIMVINQNGQLTTHGPSRTDIRQQPKDDKDNGEAAASPDAKGKGSPKPDGKAKVKGEKPKPSVKP